MKRRLRKKPVKASSVATPLAISVCSDDCDLETTVDLERRIGNPPFDKLSDAEGIKVLHEMWKFCRDAAIARCIKRSGPGIRPTLWWLHDSPAPRPFVTPRNWCLANDAARFEKERRAADLKFLREHNCLSKAEQTALAETKKTFVPEAI